VLIGKAENAVRDLIQEYAKHNPGRGVEIIFLNSNHGRKNIQVMISDTPVVAFF
jgi:hypothetical protein